MTQHPVLCAWCLRDGFHHVVRWEAYSGSHGLCMGHYLIERIRHALDSCAREVELMEGMFPRAEEKREILDDVDLLRQMHGGEDYDAARWHPLTRGLLPKT